MEDTKEKTSTKGIKKERLCILHQISFPEPDDYIQNPITRLGVVKFRLGLSHQLIHSLLGFSVPPSPFLIFTPQGLACSFHQKNECPYQKKDKRQSRGFRP